MKKYFDVFCMKGYTVQGSKQVENETCQDWKLIKVKIMGLYDKVNSEDGKGK